MEERAVAYWSTCFIYDRSFSKLVTLSLNLNTEAKSGRAGVEVVASEVIGVGVGVASFYRGLKKGGGGTVVADVIYGIAVTSAVNREDV
ncbi:hypothetical protein Tco_0996249 [Tanacetum coccineum]